MWIWILLGVLAALILLLCGATVFFFKFSMVRAKKEPPEESFFQGPDALWTPFREAMVHAQKWMHEKTEETVTIRSHDGLQLRAMYIPADTEQPRGTCIVFHGYRSLATVDFAPEVEFLHGLVYRLLVIHQRSHGESEGKYITYGMHERFDCRDWARYAAERWKDEDVFLMGISMGCATVVMSAGTELPACVRGIVADCGFTTPWEIMAHVAKRSYKLPSFPLLNGVDLMARMFAKCTLRDADTRKIMAETTLPVLFIHGKDDDFVPLHMTMENYEAYGTVSGSEKKELYLVPGAGHAQSYAKDPEGCQQAIAGFCERYGTK